MTHSKYNVYNEKFNISLIVLIVMLHRHARYTWKEYYMITVLNMLNMTNIYL